MGERGRRGYCWSSVMLRAVGKVIERDELGRGRREGELRERGGDSVGEK